MFAGIPLLLFFVRMCWMPPASLTGWPLVAWTSVALFGLALEVANAFMILVTGLTLRALDERRESASEAAAT